MMILDYSMMRVGSERAILMLRVTILELNPSIGKKLRVVGLYLSSFLIKYISIVFVDGEKDISSMQLLCLTL